MGGPSDTHSTFPLFAAESGVEYVFDLKSTPVNAEGWGVTLAECVAICAGTPEFVREFDRLSGTHLASVGKRAPIDAMVDEATGRDNDAFRQFVEFVAGFVWAPLIAEAKVAQDA